MNNQIPPTGAKDTEPFSLSEREGSQPPVMDKDSENFEKTVVEKSQLENIPNALKNAAKFLMKVVTAPPAFVLDFAGGILKNGGFFIRAVPMALGGAIGERIGAKLGENKNYSEGKGRLVGRLAGFAIFSPITVPALAIELFGQCAKLAGSLHIKGNITEELDLGVYLKLHVLGQSPAKIRKDCAKEIRKKDPKLTEEQINAKIQFKFRNQDRFKNVTLEYSPKSEAPPQDMEREIIRLQNKLKNKFEKDGIVKGYVCTLGNLVKEEYEKRGLSPETTKEKVDIVKTEALIYCITEKSKKEEKLFFWKGSTDDKYEFRLEIIKMLQRDLELSPASLEIVITEGKKIASQLS
jgi:hypothetical protein